MTFGWHKLQARVTKGDILVTQTPSSGDTGVVLTTSSIAKLQSTKKFFSPNWSCCVAGPARTQSWTRHPSCPWGGYSSLSVGRRVSPSVFFHLKWKNIQIFSFRRFFFHPSRKKIRQNFRFSQKFFKNQRGNRRGDAKYRKISPAAGKKRGFMSNFGFQSVKFGQNRARRARIFLGVNIFSFHQNK